VSATADPFERLNARERFTAEAFLRENPKAREIVTKHSESESPTEPLARRPPQWPGPLKPQAFHGIAGEIVAAIEPHTESDPAALLVQALVAFGSVAGRNAYFVVGGDRHAANLFCCLVGATAAGRKTSGWGCVRHVLREVDPAWASNRILGGLSSGEGLIWAVRDPIEKQQALREKGTGHITGYETVIEDHGIEDKRLLVLETEFASPLKVMGREGSTLSPIMRQAWDSGDLRVLTKNSPAKATDAHISVVAHITRDELTRLLTVTDAANGFSNRFLWVCSRRSKHLPDGGRLRDVNFTKLVSSLTEAVSFAQKVGELRRNDDASAIWHDVYPTLSDGRPGVFGSATSRAEAQVLRLSLIYAVLDCSRTVAREHLLAALAVWEYCENSARYIFGDRLGNPVADLISKSLRSTPEGLTRTEIRDLFDRHKSAVEIDVALAYLEENGLARRVSEKTGGRSAECWIAT
jgi:hypothetical protein